MKYWAVSEYRPHRAPRSATARSDTALLFLQRNVNFSPDRFISAHFRWIFVPGSALPAHPPPLPHLWGQLGCWSWSQNSIYFKLPHLIPRCLYDLQLNEGDIPFDLQVWCKFKNRLQTRVGDNESTAIDEHTFLPLYLVSLSKNQQKLYIV